MKKEMIPAEIADRIFYIRGRKVMFDFDLAQLYGVETRALKQQVRRNLERFPDDFIFVLTKEETNSMVSQFVIPSKSYLGGAQPMAFTEQGVAMLSSVLKSRRAVLLNISIMRAFVQLRQLLDLNRDISKRIDDLEKKYDEKFSMVFEAIKLLIRQEKEPMRAVGYKIPKQNEKCNDNKGTD